MSLGALRDAFASINAEAIYDLCGEWSEPSECRDARSVDPLLKQVCPFCVDELRAYDAGENCACGEYCGGAA